MGSDSRGGTEARGASRPMASDPVTDPSACTRQQGSGLTRTNGFSGEHLSDRHSSPTLLRSCGYRSRIPNRNVSDVNQPAFHSVQLTTDTSQLAVGFRQSAAKGRQEVETDGPKRNLKMVAFRTSRFVILLLLVLFLAVASFSLSDLGSRTKLDWLARGLAGVLAVVCAYLYMRTSKSIRMLDSSREPQDDIKLIPLTDVQLQRLKVNASRTPMGLAEAQIFALATTYPAALRQRVSERYEPERRTLRHTVSMAIKVPGDELGFPDFSLASRFDDQKFSIPIPAVLLRKGELNDELTVYGNGDEALPAYSYSEYVQLAARVLHVLLTRAFLSATTGDTKSEPEDPLTPSELEPSIQAAEDAAIRCILHRGPVNTEEIIKAVKGISSLQRRIPRRGSSPNPGTEQWQASILLQLAARFVEKLSYDYAIVVPAECRADGRVSLRYERTVIPSVELSERSVRTRKISILWFVRWSKDRLRFLLGARPVELTVPLENASTCQSFHMTVVCPEGLYLRDQLVPHVNEYMRDNARQSNVPPYCRLRRRLGQPYAHFYSRFFPEPKRPKLLQDASAKPDELQEDPTSRAPHLKLTFYEVPPASMFRAALVSITTTTLIWLVGLVVSHIRDGVLPTDAPVILFAFPAIIAAWMGFDSPGRRLFEGTLGARLSLIYSALCAIAASGLFLIYNSRLGMLHGEFDVKFSILGIGQTSWCVLFAFSALNTFYACYSTILRTWEFTHLSTRSIAGSSTTREGEYVQY